MILKKYRIGDFARQMGVTADFLRYYEQNGLITSSQNEDNGYHYYDFRQSELVSRIQYLRGMGFSMPEIREMLFDADRQRLRQLYIQHELQLKREILKKQRALRELEALHNSIENNEPGSWYIVRRPDFFFLPHTNDEDYIRDPVTAEYIRQWSDAVPLTCGAERWILKDGAFFSVQHGRLVEATIALEIGLPVEPPVLRMPGGRFLEYYLEYAFTSDFTNEPTLTGQKLQEVFDLIEKKHFTLAGDICLQILSFYVEEGRHKEQCVLYVPIK